jgi:glycosyltransferase involved in cell wall biosynthesis
MRILFANDGFADAGGVHSYLLSVMTGLCERGHDLAYLHGGISAPHGLGPALKTVPCFGTADTALEKAVSDVRAWGPQVIFSHNMGFLDVEQRLLDEWPVVKLMHGYFGTCIGGQKMFALPRCRPCSRRFGAACLALYLPRRCGEFSPRRMLSQYLWARRQNGLFNRYAAVVVASEHMKREYVRNGMKSEAVHVNPLFPTEMPGDGETEPGSNSCDSVLFLGRMTKLKGGDFLIHAVAQASQRLGQTIRLTMAGDGPRRPHWEKLAVRQKVSAVFPGWVTVPERRRLLSSASLLAMPSIWPEPFGLAGLEAASFGLPSIAFDVGGIRQWLTDGCNGWLVPGNPPTVVALADGLVRAFSQPDQLFAMRKGARQTARRMSLAAHLDRLETILGAACGLSYQAV